MRQSWRWFGPEDPIPLDHIRQAGASHIVTSLHEYAAGEVWPEADIKVRKQFIEQDNGIKMPLHWQVVESVNVHDDIKTAAPGHASYIDNYCETIRALGAQGITTVCYNFMPLIDWTRTDLSYPLASGGTCLRFDEDRFAAFDLFILKREAARQDYSDAAYLRAEQVYLNLTVPQRHSLINTILSGLPGGTTGAHTLDSFRHGLQTYQNINAVQLRQNLFRFLESVLPVAEQAGVVMAIHPDDPPRSLLGLPRILCGEQDLERLFEALPSKANGMTLCAGTYGVDADNDVPGLARTFAERIYFAHLRGTRRDKDLLSFQEADHLDSDVDMLAVIEALIAEEQHRADVKAAQLQIPIRPDHGQCILDDLDKAATNPGYTAIGRLKGLAEIRGAIKMLEYINYKQEVLQ